MSVVELARRIDLALGVIRDAQEYQHEHGHADHHTRRLPADAARALRKWRLFTVASSRTATVSPKTGARAPLSGQPTAGKQSTPTEDLQVPISQATSIRIPEELRERVDEYARERPWTLGETARVALEQLVGWDERDQGEQPKAAA